MPSFLTRKQKPPVLTIPPSKAGAHGTNAGLDITTLTLHNQTQDLALNSGKAGNNLSQSLPPSSATSPIYGSHGTYRTDSGPAHLSASVNHVPPAAQCGYSNTHSQVQPQPQSQPQSQYGRQQYNRQSQSSSAHMYSQPHHSSHNNTSSTSVYTSSIYQPTMLPPSPPITPDARSMNTASQAQAKAFDDARSHNRIADPQAQHQQSQSLHYSSHPSQQQTREPVSYAQHHVQQQHIQQSASAAPQMASKPSNTMFTPSILTSPSLSTTSSMRKTSSRYTLTDFNFIRTLGTGSFGRVHLVRSCHNTRYYAVKVLNKERVVKMKQVEHTNSEREMLERVRHPFLVNLWGTFKDPANLYMVMDFVSGGELFSLLRKSQRFPDPVAKFFGAEVALALDYLHSLDIIYRDLKPENILLAADGHVKVTDFGFAKYVPDITWTLCGTPDYLAPEIVQSKGYNKSVDWYALGVLIFEMLAGYPPFFTEDTNPMRLYEKIIAGKIRYPSYFSPEAKDLLRNLLTADLTKRYGNLANGSRDIFAHGWFGEVDWERLYRKEIPAPYVPRVEGDGDASCFEAYAEIDIASEYGQPGPDPHGHLFALF